MRSLGAILATLLLILSPCDTLFADAPEGTLSAVLAEDGVAEVMVDFGDVKYADVVTRTIVLRNMTDAPVALVDYETTCRCVWLTLPKGVVAPGDSVEVVVAYDSRGEWGSVGNYISIITSNDRCRVAVWMSAEIVR